MEVSAAPCRELFAEEQEASSNMWEASPSVMTLLKRLAEAARERASSNWEEGGPGCSPGPRLKGQEEGPDLLHVGRQSVHPGSQPAPCLLFGGGHP